MNPVVHFEMPFEDQNRMVEFYSKTFGWKPNILGPEMGNYVVVDTSERDEVTKFPNQPGRINGGFYKKNAENPNPSIVIAVEDIHAAMKRITEGGGKVLGEPVMIPGTGEYVSFIDSEGNKCSIIKPLTM
jgi:uncharacterized protein